MAFLKRALEQSCYANEIQTIIIGLQPKEKSGQILMLAHAHLILSWF